MIRVYCDRCNVLMSENISPDIKVTLPVLNYDNNGNIYIVDKLCLCYDCLTKYIDYCEGREVKEVRKLKTIIE